MLPETVGSRETIIYADTYMQFRLWSAWCA